MTRPPKKILITVDRSSIKVRRSTPNHLASTVYFKSKKSYNRQRDKQIPRD